MLNVHCDSHKIMTQVKFISIFVAKSKKALIAIDKREMTVHNDTDCIFIISKMQMIAKSPLSHLSSNISDLQNDTAQISHINYRIMQFVFLIKSSAFERKLTLTRRLTISIFYLHELCACERVHFKLYQI